MTNGSEPALGKFYILRADMRGGGRGNGVEVENEDDIPFPAGLSVPPEAGGLANLKVKPRLRHKRRLGEMPKDLQSGITDYWLVSEPLKQLLASVDPEGFAFAECEFVLEDGATAAPHYFCEVTRVLDAVDLASSTVKVLTEGYRNGKYYSASGGARLAFDTTVVGAAHVFVTPYTADVFCDRVLRDALIAGGFGVGSSTRGVRLIDAAGI
ncbi:imm11 family protein [Stenotrophomonas sp. NPDC077659]|uniref:imm11 family protein n=1 Tax=Stenotrophomonas sp. NPDC077659 TaxID=3390694 RepID=UPI003D00F499